ncbi:MAG TPA: hypothetical protein VLL54_00090 [Pyrinomonadaceae bacterium]|nr:hypothetical protein [Pyrinomonadaceae bacterium]
MSSSIEHNVTKELFASLIAGGDARDPSKLTGALDEADGGAGVARSEKARTMPGLFCEHLLL